MSSDLLNKRIGITGASGFLGKAVMRKLNEYGVDRKNIYAPSSTEVNLKLSDDVEGFVKKCDLIIHLAANVGGILYNKKFPGDLLNDNLIMGTNLFEAIKNHPIEKMVNIGTTCMYPANAPIPFNEDHIWNGYPAEVTAPYGIAKKILFEQSKAFKKQYAIDSINLIPVNLYGPEDHFHGDNTHVVPALIKRIFEAKQQELQTVEVWGTGKATREFLYVNDAAEGIISALQSYNQTIPINLGTGEETSIKELVKLICDQVGFKGSIVWDSSKPDGTLRRCVDTSKAEKCFGFKAKTSLEVGLSQTIEWFSNNPNNH